MINRAATIFALVAVIVLGGCATQVHQQTTELARGGRTPRIVLMPPDVELAELTAGGLQEPKAEWTEAAHRYLEAALAQEAAARNLEVTSFASDKGAPEDRDTGLELVKLHRAVGGSILVHQYLEGHKLPSKQGRFDWSLGAASSAIARSQDADYALFLFVRDSYTSAGRVAVIMVGALLGVGVAGGTQVGFASLVDLRTGDIVWFNRLVRGSGDLRTPEGAGETVKVLLTDLPR